MSKPAPGPFPQPHLADADGAEPALAQADSGETGEAAPHAPRPRPADGAGNDVELGDGYEPV